MSASRVGSAEFVAIRLRARDAEQAERAAAEAFEAGAAGSEEREGPEGLCIVLYAPTALADAVETAAASAGALPIGRDPVPAVDWVAQWKQSVLPFEISPRLCIRPSFRSIPARPGQRVVVIDPGQAFGTGGHQSTHLVLEWIDDLADSLEPGACLLDVGTGSGVLSLAALALAPLRAVAFDLDPLAGAAARDNARANGLAARLHVFVGGVEALAPAARFPLIVANLLRRELEPVLPALAAHLAPAGRLVLAGLLAAERAPLVRLAAAQGLDEIGVRERRDESGETWIALLMRARRAATPPGGPA